MDALLGKLFQKQILYKKSLYFSIKMHVDKISNFWKGVMELPEVMKISWFWILRRGYCKIGREMDWRCLTWKEITIPLVITSNI